MFLSLLVSFFKFTNRNVKRYDIIWHENIVEKKYYNQTSETLEVSKEYFRNYQLDKSYPDWQSNLTGDTNISALSIPGTHESCALYGGVFVQCQNMDLKSQLEFGIRVFDIRCRQINDAFFIHHGAFYQNQKFGTHVRNVMVDFLKAHPTEFILMMVKEEYVPAENTKTFDQVMRSYIYGFERYFYLTEKNPTVDEVRGKIVLLRRFNTTFKPLGNEIKFLDDQIFNSSTTIDCHVQDVYLVYSGASKWEYFYQTLEKTKDKNDVAEDWFYINYGSGTGVIIPPITICSYVNKQLITYLQSHQNTITTGILMLDFVNQIDPADVINKNQKYMK